MAFQPIVDVRMHEVAVADALLGQHPLPSECGLPGGHLLAEFQPDIIKLGMALVRAIDTDPVRQAIVHGILGVCEALSTEVIAEGVETAEELVLLQGFGINLFQCYLFARPGFECLPEVTWPDLPRPR